MSNHGFKFIKLELIGKDLPTAKILFKSGLNVITGASDTGKSFILQCIDYMLGAESPPKKIDEAKGYEYIHLTIRKNIDDKEYKIKRSLNKNRVIFVSSNDNEPDLQLKPKSDAKDKDNISAFLLELIGLSDKKVKKNSKNETVNLSFRDISHLCIISEKEIITDKSPILTPHVMNQTKEKSVFSLLLTGNDDSGLPIIENRKTTILKKDVKIEVLEELIEQYSNDKEYYSESSEIEIKIQIDKLSTYFKNLEKSLNNLQYSADFEEKKRQNLWDEVRLLNDELHTKKVLIERFKLLNKKYDSDLNRLNATIEANYVFDGLKAIDCFFCGAIPENKSQPTVESYNADEIANACLKEINNIKILKKELVSTLFEIEENSNEMSNFLIRKKQNLVLIEQRIKTEIKPRINILLKKLQSTQEEIYQQKNSLSYVQKINLFKEKITTLEYLDTIKVKPLTVDRQINKEINQICIEIENRVQQWKLFKDPRIAFNDNYKVYDITISGKERGGYGKGFRALTYSAFSLSLLKYCQKEKRPHPMFVILDSPLVVFKEPEPDVQGDKVKIKYNFFKEILSDFINEQVIIFENEDVPEDLKSKMNLIEFSGNQNLGRYGFIPIKQVSNT